MPRLRRTLQYWENPKHRGIRRQGSAKRKRSNACVDADDGDNSDESLDEEEDDGASGDEEDDVAAVERPRARQRTLSDGFSKECGLAAPRSTEVCDSSDVESTSLPDDVNPRCGSQKGTAMRRSPSGTSQNSDATHSSTATRLACESEGRRGGARYDREECASVCAPEFESVQFHPFRSTTHRRAAPSPSPSASSRSQRPVHAPSPRAALPPPRAAPSRRPVANWVDIERGDESGRGPNRVPYRPCSHA
jgi:hypothetical protein